MTLLELRDAHPETFYPQTWYDAEPFAALNWEHGIVPPSGLCWYGEIPRHLTRLELHPAVALAWAYIVDPTAEVWKSYLWTSDIDSHGQRVYVGQNGKGLEVHRHIHITHRFAVPTW